jgi:hypothetical protein
MLVTVAAGRATMMGGKPFFLLFFASPNLLGNDSSPNDT